MIRYRRTQIGYLTTCVLFCAVIGAAVTGLVKPAGKESLLIRAMVEVILLASAIVFSSLTITIDDEKVTACFTLGFLCKRVRTAEIAECEPIRVRWWYGWGIHLTPYGWLYNVSGLDAVAITLRNGRKLALGTDDLDGLVNAIRRFTAAR